MELPPPARKTIDLEGRLVKDGFRALSWNRQTALGDPVDAIRQCRKLADKIPLTLRGSAHAVQELDCTIDRAGAPSQRLHTGNAYPTIDLCY
jgi:hypothetical protein